MPSALVQRIATATPTVSATATAAATNNSGGASADHHQIPIKHCSLPPALIRELSLHSPSLLKPIPDTLYRFHNRPVGPGQVCSAVVRTIAAPVDAVWSVVRRFDNPLAYKRFLKSCHIIVGDGHVGTLREVRVVSGLPAAWSTERLDVLDDERHVISFSVVGGEHRLRNYRSVTTLHECDGGCGSGDGTVVVESYVVDVPAGNTREETCVFADTIVRCNLNSLAQITEELMNNSHVS